MPPPDKVLLPAVAAVVSLNNHLNQSLRHRQGQTVALYAGRRKLHPTQDHQTDFVDPQKCPPGCCSDNRLH